MTLCFQDGIEPCYGDGSGASEVPIPDFDDFFADLPPGFDAPPPTKESVRPRVVAEGSRIINGGDQVEIARVIKEEVKKELRKSLEEAQLYMHTVAGPKLALVIDGKCLMYALDPSLRVTLLSLSLNCTSVVCCRVSPLQKAQVRFR
ncbi:hypothetical protein Bca52824_048132 [Brassica carinata]|uniref:Uncharacterized protein n=1 Tax=Brassica carinata TaxID=52824 RepID=A0A8X7RKC1_BRACI|nr:hypothetical protein Bca52824_048132 [Brassica carinata]